MAAESIGVVQPPEVQRSKPRASQKSLDSSKP